MIGEFIIYLKTEHGPEYNISTGSTGSYYRFDFTISDSRMTPATWYNISLVAVAGEETSERSDTIRAGTGKFILIIYPICTKAVKTHIFSQKMRYLKVVY